MRIQAVPKVFPAVEVECKECGDLKELCHNAFQHFPRDRCAAKFYESVSDVLHDCFTGETFTLDQFHQELVKEVYLHFRGIKNREELTKELLIDIFVDDLRVAEGLSSGLYRVL